MLCRRKFSCLALILGLSSAAVAADNLTIDQLLARHRAAIGSEQALKAVNSRVAEGTSTYQVLSGGSGTIEGKATVVSQGRNLREVWKYNTSEYRGEDFLSNGDKVQVLKGALDSRSKADPKRSLLGSFLWTQTTVLRDGLFGGTLSTAWPLLAESLRDAKLSYEGLKTIDGVPLHEVLYKAKKSQDAEIRLYFEPETFRHVLTVASMNISPQLLTGTAILEGDFIGRERQIVTGGSDVMNARQQTIRYRLEQRFGAFQQFDGLTLPTECTMHFSGEGYAGAEVSYKLKFDNVMHNISLDPRNFELK